MVCVPACYYLGQQHIILRLDFLSTTSVLWKNCPLSLHFNAFCNYHMQGDKLYLRVPLLPISQAKKRVFGLLHKECPVLLPGDFSLQHDFIFVLGGPIPHLSVRSQERCK